MEVPSLSAGGVGSRFVSQEDIETAKARRDEQWKAAYARLGQEPPPQPATEDSYDGRSLAEKLAANRIAKQEEWEEKTKLANQFRALEEDEVMFLDSLREKQEEEERQRKEKDGEEVQGFRQAVAARTAAENKPPPLVGAPSGSSKPTTAPAKPTAPPPKKDPKKALKGVIVKKKKPANPPSSETKTPEKPAPTATSKRNAEDDAEADTVDAKRRKV